MRGRSLVVLAALLAGPALAEEAGNALRAKALVSAASSTAEPAHDAPRLDPYAEIFKAPPAARANLRDACAARDLCYDMNERRVVYRPARAYMPAFDGLRAESISVRQDRVTLRYSFR